MLETLDWMASVEAMAGEVYRTAAAAFSGDREISVFLESLADDEAWHGEIIGEARRCLSVAGKTYELAIDVDAETRERLQQPLVELRALLQEDALSIDTLLDRMVRVECSELNDVFTYIVGSLGMTEKVFQLVAATVDGHQRRIEQFLSQHPSGWSSLEQFKSLPSVWTANILVVEDSAPVAQLLAAIGRMEGRVDIAENGREALEKVREKYYDLVFSDVRMPVMDGIEFFSEFLKEDPTAGQRFVFCTGEQTPEITGLLKEHDVTYLQKPVDVGTIQNLIRRKLREKN